MIYLYQPTHVRKEGCRRKRSTAEDFSAFAEGAFVNAGEK